MKQQRTKTETDKQRQTERSSSERRIIRIGGRERNERQTVRARTPRDIQPKGKREKEKEAEDDKRRDGAQERGGKRVKNTKRYRQTDRHRRWGGGTEVDQPVTEEGGRPVVGTRKLGTPADLAPPLCRIPPPASNSFIN